MPDPNEPRQSSLHEKKAVRYNEKPATLYTSEGRGTTQWVIEQDAKVVKQGTSPNDLTAMLNTGVLKLNGGRRKTRKSRRHQRKTRRHRK